jgi:ribosome-binding protein aMBF1 (putative translation factor)
VSAMNSLRHGYFKDVDPSYSFPDSRATEFVRQTGVTLVEHVFVRFGARLRRERTRRGVSQEKLAEMAGLHRTYVSTVERGLRNISLLNIEKLARALQVSMSKLMPE